MEYKVVSIAPSISRNESQQKVALELAEVINKYADQGWEFLQVEKLETWITGTQGCFGLGAKPGYNLTMHMIVFKK